jgi:pyrimidine deaminase RibD-like protein
MNSVQAAMENAGLEITPLQEWCVTWPAADKLRNEVAKATLYLTVEPTHKRRGQVLPPITQLIELSGVRRVVVGCQDPVPKRATKGASALHAAGIEVTMESILAEECRELIKDYAGRANGKLQRMARTHFEQFQRPLGFLHCSVVDSDNLEAFANHGNSFGKDIDGKRLSFRDFGAYEIAPPPEVIWADSQGDEFDIGSEEPESLDDILSLEFDEEDEQESMGGSPMMPWYEQVDAVVATFPHKGNGPNHDDSVTGRLNGLKWLGTYGNTLPVGVERILVMDATDLEDLPMSNTDPNLPRGVDVEKFWKGEGRKPTRVLLRRGRSAQAQSAAKVAAEAAQAAARAAAAAQEAIETGDAESAAKAALEGQQAAVVAFELAQKELMRTLELKQKLTGMGAIVETLNGGEPIDVMKHLGRRNGYESVVWRAGCWGNRGVDSILAGAFQWVSAHLAVDAFGGKFWQLMLAERAVQGACGPESKVKVFAGQEDISLEYCDEPEADGDCTLTVDGKPIRHVRLDCRVALVDAERPRDFVLHKTKKMDRHVIEEEAPWFL